MGQGEYAFDLDDFRTEDLKSSFLQLAGNIEVQIDKIKERKAEYKHALDEQDANVLKLLA